MSIRHCCGLVKLKPSSFYYSCKEPNDGALKEALKEVAQKRKRWGYRLLTILLRRKGFTDNLKRIYRVYREERLQVQIRKKKKTAKWRGEKLSPAMSLNERWSMDFVSDQLSNGRKIRIFTLVDNFSRECLALEADTSLTGLRVIRVLESLKENRGLPKKLLSDNGSEFTGKNLDKWAYSRDVEQQFIEPGKPIQNAFVESFNGTFRDECLNEHWFKNLEEVKTTIEAWRNDYNHFRPHSSLGYQTPAEFSDKIQGKNIQRTENQNLDQIPNYDVINPKELSLNLIQ